MRFERLNVLIVEDNRHTRTMLSQILRAVGIVHIFETADGAEALKMMRAHEIDVVLTDLAMEPVDGVEFVRQLRNSPDSPNQMTPVIMITGHSTMRRIREARDAGVNEFIVKPLTARAVIERLHMIVDHARPYIRTDDYFGPDRRRRSDPKYEGPWRRAGDKAKVQPLKSSASPRFGDV